MHNFMTISSEFGMRKFFMDRFQRAYISLDTLLVYMIVYPYCPEFLQARSEVARFLQSYRELPCCRCGFIKRDCRCNGQLYFGKVICEGSSLINQFFGLLVESLIRVMYWVVAVILNRLFKPLNIKILHDICTHICTLTHQSNRRVGYMQPA